MVLSANCTAKRLAALALSMLLLVALAVPLAVGAQAAGETVRVGWYESSYNTQDASGRRTGYAYEYQMKLAAYTGWKYEYVTGSWSELLRMLVDGEIDLMSDVSYTEERAQTMLYPDLPMGTEEYYVFIAPGNTEIIPGNYTTLNGKRVGANKNSVQADYYLEWARQHGVQSELIEVTSTEEESLKMLETGELDAYVTVDSFTDPECAVPVCKVGASDFYFAVSKKRPELLSELNDALSRLQDENRFYNQQLYEQYIIRAGANAFLSASEVSWLEAHGTIRVGYQDSYLAFCAADEETGRLTGTLKDFLDLAAYSMANARLDFSAAAYPTASAALDALNSGEIDCVFPVNLKAYDGEKRNLVMTPPLTDTDIYAIVRQADQHIFTQKEHVVVAVNEGNPNYEAFLQEHFPSWRKVYYPETAQCLKAVSDGVADCVLISSFRYNNIARLCEKYRLTSLSTGMGLDYCFAVGSGNTELYSILAKAIGLVPSSTLHAALIYYTTEDARLSFTDFLADNIGTVLAVVAVVVLVILVLMVYSIRAEKKAARLISATETDELTGLYSRNYFFEYANRMYRAQPETPMDAIVLNLEKFHSVNALNGRAFGDRVLQTLGNEIRAILSETDGIAGRFEADRFDIYCRHTEDHQAIYDRLQHALDDLAPTASLRLRIGVMTSREKLEPVQLFDRARTACNMARGHFMEHLIVFDEKVRERELFEQRLMNDLRRALNGYEFEVYYQPKYDITANPPRPVSAEALIRWHHPEYGMIHPDEFIPLLEKTGGIKEVDKFVWNEAAAQIVRWREHYGVTVPVSVNLSRIDVFDPQLESTLDRILSFNGLPHDALSLEVTESAYTENADQVIRVVESLREKGYVVEMDDFGTGYSSLNMLSSMPIDVLKMDRAFIRNIEHSEKDVQLVALILGISKNLKIPVVAEGVETPAQLRLLQAQGCGLAQGYYFSHPLPPSEFEAAVIPTMQLSR